MQPILHERLSRTTAAYTGVRKRLSACLLMLVCFSGGLMASELANGGVVVIGASYAGGWQIDSLATMPVSNRGVGGEETHEILARFEGDVIVHGPRYVIIWGFINDIFRSHPQDWETRLLQSFHDIDRMVVMARETGIEPVLVTEITMARPPGLLNSLRAWYGALRGKESYRERVNREVSAMNLRLREYARDERIPVLDFETLLAGPDGWRRPGYATEDGSHISPEGYRALTAYVVANWSTIVPTSANPGDTPGPDQGNQIKTRQK